MLRGVITEKTYTNYVEPTTRELEQIEAQLAQLQKQRVTLEELTKQVKADLAGTWEQANYETRLDLQHSLFGRYLYFEPNSPDPFSNQKNTLLTERWLLYIAEAGEDTGILEGWVGDGPEPEEEESQVGVGDGD